MSSTALIIDDSETLRSHVSGALQNAGLFDRVLTAENGLRGFQTLRSHSVDLVLCDLNMPGFDGHKFLMLKRGDSAYADIPVIMLTARGEVESKVRLLSAGASDYLTKPFDDAELVARVGVHLKMKRLTDALRDKNEDLERLSRTDPLTGIANRRYLMDRCAKEFARSLRYARPLSIMMVDIDHFKKVNDTHGHQVGDKVIVSVAGELQSGLRTHDLVGRYGGEEFMLMLPETDVEGARSVAERCRRDIGQLSFEASGGESFGLTVSMGLAAGPSEVVASLDELIRMADTALYEAKRQGRDRLIAA